jgi:hypothetical protein
MDFGNIENDINNRFPGEDPISGIEFDDVESLEESGDE